MTTENTSPETENTEPASSGDTDAQLAAMQAEEKEPAPEKVEPEPEAKVKEEKVVPLAALHEERRARQELQRQLAESNRSQAERDAIIERRLAALAPQQQMPDKLEQPVEYLDQRLSEVAATNKQILERDQQREQEAQRQHIERQATQAVLASAAEFAKVQPDLPEAGKYLNEMRARELMLFGMAEAQAIAQATQEQDNALKTWAYQGMNAAQMAYDFAKARGYQPKAQANTAEQKIAAQQKGTAAAKSLGGGGAVNAGKLTAEALASMSDEEFSKLTESQFRQAMGG